jgi:predicted enzyme related to lactoylglutathione lyase
MEAMVAFYSEAFNAHFREVDTFGIRSQFAEIDGITLKFVPIRDAADFENYPVHQLGFSVPDVEAILTLAQQHGGRPEGDILRNGDAVHAAVRDPDGNTIELYSAPNG